MGMGCRPSKQNSDKLNNSSNLVKPRDRHVIGGFLPPREKSVLFADRNSDCCVRDVVKTETPETRVYDTSCKFNDFSTSTATYRQRGGKNTEQITVRLSTDGTTLEIEHLEHSSIPVVDDTRMLSGIRRTNSAPDLPTLQTTSVRRAFNDVLIPQHSKPLTKHNESFMRQRFPKDTIPPYVPEESVVLRQGSRMRDVYDNRCVSFPYSTRIGEKLRAMLSQNGASDGPSPAVAVGARVPENKNGVEDIMRKSGQAPLAKFDERFDESPLSDTYNGDVISIHGGFKNNESGKVCGINHSRRLAISDINAECDAIVRHTSHFDLVTVHRQADGGPDNDISDDVILRSQDDVTNNDVHIDDAIRHCVDDGLHYRKRSDDVKHDRHNTSNVLFDNQTGNIAHFYTQMEDNQYFDHEFININHQNSSDDLDFEFSHDNRAVFCCDLSNFHLPFPSDSNTFDINDSAVPNNSPVPQNACFVTEFVSKFAPTIEEFSDSASNDNDSDCKTIRYELEKKTSPETSNITFGATFRQSQETRSTICSNSRYPRNYDC